MGLLRQKSETDQNIEDQIKVLATNIEVLNQKLISDPNSAITPGEAILKKQLMQTAAKLDYLENFLHQNQKQLSSELLGSAKGLQDSFTHIQTSMQAIPKERHALNEEIKRLNQVINSIAHMDKKWLQSLLSRLEILNKNAHVLNENLGTFYTNLTDEVDKQVKSISEEVSARIFKSMIWFVAAIIVLTLVFTLIFTKFMM